ncbi:hypothetical protein [Segniliparus rugosus]|uniref:hypothetical protein n=1 Tax=Segniliparus rugosus TaxID=286804 RepID=UPI0012EBFA93|nr:hypothetical protein [Segniliparus rugosus]
MGDTDDYPTFDVRAAVNKAMSNAHANEWDEWGSFSPFHFLKRLEEAGYRVVKA